MRVLVIGAGVVGAAVAAGLTRRGARVTVLEERFPGAGTTGTSFAWVNANDKDPGEYFALNHTAVHAYHALGGDGFVPTGHIEWANGETRRVELSARVERLRDREYAVERLTAGRAAELEPDLAAQPDGTDYVLFPEEGHVIPAVLLARLLGEARDRGARVETGAAVREIKSGGGSVSVTLADGGVRAADVLVSCAGRWTGGLVDVPVLDPRVSGTVTNGFLVTTTPVPARLARVLTGDRLNVRPDGGGRLMLQALDLDDAADPETPPPDDVGAEMLARLPEVLSATDGARVERTRVGQRAMPADRLTVAGFTDPAARVYAVVTHSGITLAPLLGDLVAGEVYGKESALLRPFRPTRFAEAPAAPAPAAECPPRERG
ncbi:FAD-binding oxidoreductase [Actinoallomurus purpureus]|uniref:NAD(P)/FAD-dependent oxidoreductase n=1 Tax=Actinoallomurus purpureus TaxID=478114 RepID=UPI0020927A4E|nr:FAD-binding oxidoreductase [Actinoallomurus purpureus]MCO6009203.1 FAD-binding oxidoreductase [Actinoallomurus purpureus]